MTSSEEPIAESPLHIETEETSGESEDIAGQAEDSFTRMVEPIGKMLSDWKWVLIICALVVSIVMVFAGLLSIR